MSRLFTFLIGCWAQRVKKRLKRKNPSVNIADDHFIDSDDSSDSDTEQVATTSKNKKQKSKYKPALRFKEHFLSHYGNDIRNLAPLPYLKTDKYERNHSHLKGIRNSKRNSINVLKTMITNHEILQGIS